MKTAAPTPRLARPVWRLVAAAALALGAALARAPAFAADFTVAVVPQFSALEVQVSWGPLLERLAARTGHRFRLLPQTTIPAFESTFRQGTPDFVFLNPYHMVMARAAQGYVPLLRDGQQPLSGVLVVEAGSRIQGIRDLDGQAVAFPSPNAFGASLYMRALLAARGVRIEPQYVKTHRNAYRQVLAGQAAAAGGVKQTLQKESADVRDGLRVLFETPPVAPHPLAAHPRVPQALQRELRELLLAWAREGGPEAAMLSAVQLPAPVAADYRLDYEPLEKLGLQKFVVVEPN